MLIYCGGRETASIYPGVAKFGIALEWGSRGLEFESRHSDQTGQLRLSRFFFDDTTSDGSVTSSGRSSGSCVAPHADSKHSSITAEIIAIIVLRHMVLSSIDNGSVCKNSKRYVSLIQRNVDFNYLCLL